MRWHNTRLKHAKTTLASVPVELQTDPATRFVEWEEVYDPDRGKTLKKPTKGKNWQQLTLPWSEAKDSKDALGLQARGDDAFVVIDIDGVPLDQNAELKDLLEAMPTYIEESPSGGEKNKFHAIYRLPEAADKLGLASKPTVFQAHHKKDDPEPKQEIQLFISAGYTTLTGQPIEDHPYYSKNINTITRDGLMALWPKTVKRALVQDTQINQDTQANQSGQDRPTSGLLQRGAASTPVDAWIQNVSLDPGNPQTLLLMEKLDYNHYDYWLVGLMSILAAHPGAPMQAMVSAYSWSQSHPESFKEESFQSTWQSLTNDVEAQLAKHHVTERTYEMYYLHFMPIWPVIVGKSKNTPVHTEYLNFKFWLDHLGLKFNIDPLSQTAFLDGPDSILYPKLYEDKLEHDTGGNEVVPRLMAILTDLARDHKFRPSHRQVIEHMDTLALQVRHSKMINRFARQIDAGPQHDPNLDDDYIGMMTRDIIRRNDAFEHPTQEFHHTLIKKWLFTVARTFWPDELAKQHRKSGAEGMLIVSSRNTGVGKSDLPNWLLPEEWRHLHIETTPQFGSKHEDKDFYGKICTRLIVNFDEIDKMLTGEHQAALKSYVTALSDTFRAPWGHSIVSHPRMHATYSSTNKETLLLAKDGIRRWWWLNVDYIDLGVLKDGWPIMKMWAQVKHELIEASLASPHEKAPWHLTKKELKYLESYLSSHTAVNSTVLDLRSQYDMTKEGWQDRYNACLKHKYTASEATANLNGLKEHFKGVKSAGLAHTLSEELRKIAPETARYGRVIIRHGVYKTGNQVRYLMPTSLAGEIFNK